MEPLDRGLVLGDQVGPEVAVLMLPDSEPRLELIEGAEPHSAVELLLVGPAAQLDLPVALGAPVGDGRGDRWPDRADAT